MDNLITANIVAACDNCPWLNKDNLIQAAHDSPKWFDQVQAAWREVVALGADAIDANVAYVNQRLGVNLTTDWIKGSYGPQ